MKINLMRLFKVRNIRKIKMFSMAIIFALALSVSALPAALAATWYVDAGATGGDGSSWVNAYALF